MPPRRDSTRERKLKTFARDLRSQQTDAESRLWYLLRDRRFSSHKFRRQHPIADYILDFYCPEQQLAIELDGGQHAEQQRYDEHRTHVLAGLGIRILRFWNHDVLQQTEAVLQAIADALDEDVAPHPRPLSPQAGRGENMQSPLHAGENMQSSSHAGGNMQSPSHAKRGALDIRGEQADSFGNILPSPHAMGRGAGGEGRAAATQSPHTRALALLARREHSRAELTRKLQDAGYTLEALTPLLDAFEAQNWLSDRRFAESYVADHRARDGSVKLAHALRQRGVADTLIEAVLDDNRDSEPERARAVWQKKFGQPQADATERARQQRFLQGRGFTAEAIRRAMRDPDDD